jgi:hypothetical protein
MPDKTPKILVGWKEIASYLRCSVRVAKRKAQLHDLPVSYDADGRIRAIKEDIDAWIRRGYQKGSKTYRKRT